MSRQSIDFVGSTDRRPACHGSCISDDADGQRAAAWHRRQPLMSVSIDRIDPLLSPILARDDVAHQIRCSTAGIGEVVSFHLVAPVSLMHRFERYGVSNALGPQPVDGHPMGIRCGT
jgi:hypothetical protein